MRIAIGQISHETNVFSPIVTDLARFEVARGEEIAGRFAGTRTPLGGMLDAARQAGAQVAPLLAASAEPSGLVTREAYETLKGELLQRLAAALPVDAVALALHGAMVAEGAMDAECDILAAVRALVGPEVPVAATLDLHGNLTPECVALADGLFGYHLYPHVDGYERGVECLEFLMQRLRGMPRPHMYLKQLPMLTAANKQASAVEPARSLNERCWEWEKRPGVLDCCVFHGFPFSDTPFTGTSVLATATSPELARQAAEDVAAEAWRRREEFRHGLPSPEEAVRRALAMAERPVVINEGSDNPGGGGSGDGTHLLSALLEAGATETAFSFIADPEAVDIAHRAGVGARVRLRLGAKTDRYHGEPLDVEAYVRCLTDGQWTVTSPMGRGLRRSLGRTACLAIGGVEVIVAERRSQTYDAEVFRIHGIQPERLKICAVKSAAHFRASFEPIAAAIIGCDGRGMTSREFTRYPWKHIRRPIWPLDPL